VKISILSPDLSNNCLGRAYLLAKILKRRYQIEIVGPIFGEGIWEPVANDKGIKYKSVKLSGRFKPYRQISELIKQIDGDVIYASKPLFTSFGIGMLRKLKRKKTLILDIDDWQMGIIKEKYKNKSFTQYLKLLISSAIRFYSMNSYWNNLISEKLINFADEITVSNNFLKKKFNATIVWHGRDTNDFNPQKYDKNLLKEKYKIEGTKKIVMFIGTLRPHKGVDDLIDAINIFKNKEVVLSIIGITNKDKFCEKILKHAKKLLGNRFLVFGIQPFDKIPQFLAMADVVVIPQKKNLATIGQIPAKLFDAMAMAKAIIATDVSDIPEILDGCGWVVEPENPEKLADAIKYVFDHPLEAETMGQKAREKCIDRYSWEAMEKVLINIFKKYE
jgi:glycosyltransferase involved in cell wall biosynthesis